MASSQAVTDAQLIARCLVDDDRHAFAELVKRHQSAVRACLRKLTAGNHALADDLAQETFVLAWRNLAAFRREALLGDRDDAVADADGDDDTGDDAGADHARSSTLKIDMERALATLSEAERAAIVQCYHNDLSHEEAAYVLGCPVGTVKTHVLRGKQKLKRALAAWSPGPAAG